MCIFYLIADIFKHYTQYRFQQELLTLREHMSSPPFFLVGSMLLIFLVLCCSIMCLYVLSSVLWCPLRFPHENDVRFVFTSWRMSYYLCLLTYTGVQHILCFAFVFVFLRRVYSMLPVSLDCPFMIAPSVFSNVYLITSSHLWRARKHY